MNQQLATSKPQFFVLRPYPQPIKKYTALSNAFNERATKQTIESPLSIHIRKIDDENRSGSQNTMRNLSKTINPNLNNLYNTNATRQTVNYNPKIQDIQSNIDELEQQLNLIGLKREQECKSLTRTYSPMKNSKTCKQIKNLTQVKTLVWNYEKRFQ